MEENNIAVIFEYAQRGDWENVNTEITNQAKSFSDIAQPNDNDFNRNLLHYACGTDNPGKAVDAVNMILDHIKRLGHGYDELLNFVNSNNSNNRTPLHIAIERGLDEVIKILLKEEAKIEIKFDSTFNQKYHKVLLSVLDRGVALQQDECDKLDESLWVVSCDFSLITGEAEISTKKSENSNASLGNGHKAKPNENAAAVKKLPETQLFAQILNLPREKRFNLLMHPLVQLFVHQKCQKYIKVTAVSIVFHILWYLVTAFTIIGTMTSVSANNTTRDVTNANSTDVAQTTQVWIGYIISQPWFQIILTILFVIMILKEAIELVICPSKTYHFKQMEKIGQYAVIVAIVIIFVIETIGTPVDHFYEWAQIIFSVLYSFGFIASLLLIQGQFSKTVWCGVTNHMMMKGFKKLLWFILPFTPMFAAYGIFFNALLPNDPSFSLLILLPKALSMQTGELNFGDVFSEENMERKYLFIFPAAIVLTVFIIAMVILFPILLTGLTIDNIAELKEEAIAAHAASRLEVANIFESFWARIQNMFECKTKQSQTNDIEMSEEVAGSSNATSDQRNVSRKATKNKHKKSPIKNEGLPLTFTYTVAFEEIPDDIKGLFYKNINNYLISKRKVEVTN